MSNRKPLNREYFFCYSPNVHKYLNNTKSISFICAAKHESTNKKFWLYEQTEELSKALNEYNTFFKGCDVN